MSRQFPCCSWGFCVLSGIMSVCYLSCRSRAAEFTKVCVAFQSGFISLQASVLLCSLNLVRSSLYFIAAGFMKYLPLFCHTFLLFKNERALKIVKLSFYFFFCYQIVKISPFTPCANTRGL